MRSGESAGRGMSPPVEITNVRCAAVHCYIATKMVSIKPVKDEPPSHLTGSGTNYCALKLVRFPWLILYFVNKFYYYSNPFHCWIILIAPGHEGSISFWSWLGLRSSSPTFCFLSLNFKSTEFLKLQARIYWFKHWAAAITSPGYPACICQGVGT